MKCTYQEGDTSTELDGDCKIRVDLALAAQGAREIVAEMIDGLFAVYSPVLRGFRGLQEPRLRV